MIAREKQETSRTFQPSKKRNPRKITLSRCVADGSCRWEENFRAANRVGRCTRRGQIRKLRSRRSEWRLGHPPGSYRSLRHMASLDARERVSLSSLGRSRTHTRSCRRRVGIILRVHRRRSHPGWLFLRTPGQSRLGKIVFEPAVAPPLCCHRCTSLAGTHYGVWFNH